MKRHIAFIFAFGLLLTGCADTATSTPDVVKPHVPAQLVHESQTSVETHSPSPSANSSEKPSTLSAKAYRFLQPQKYLLVDVVTQDNATPNCVLRADNVLVKVSYDGPYTVPEHLNIRAMYHIRHASKPNPKGAPQECRDGAYVFLSDAQWRSKTGELQPYTGQ